MKRMSIMMRTLLLTVLVLVSGLAADMPTLTRHGVTVSLSLEPVEARQADLIATFTPEAGHHVYALTLPADAAGIPTKVELAPGSPARAFGPARADLQTHDLNGLQVFPEGPVTLRLGIDLPEGAKGTTVPVTVLVSYLACTADSCRIPVIKAPLTLAVPALPRSGAAPLAAPPGPSLDEVRNVVREELARHATESRREGINWIAVATKAEAEAAIARAHAAKRAVVLDFTGPSCNNCQVMEKTVFRAPAVMRALGTVDVVKVNTDPPYDELAAWQQSRFQSQNRPLYVRLGADGSETRWNALFSPADAATMERFLAFIAGGAGRDLGTGSGLTFVWLALLGGLVTLLMPCTYPMIPFTLNVFAKQAAAGRRLLPLALFYGAGIMGCFIGLGVLITGVFGANLATLAGHPVTNLVIAALFIVLGFGLMGAFLIRLPAGLEGAVGGSRGGYLGALIMGLTFAVTAFSCTAPFAGSVLAAAVATGTWGTAVWGMAIYSGAIAVPFMALALSPGLLKKLPKAGSWMNEFKVVGGLVELAAALKFLVICDHAWGWGIFGRGLVLATWAGVAVVLAAYVSGCLRLAGDSKIEEIGIPRLLLTVAFAALAAACVAGLAGAELGFVEGFFP